MQKKTHSLIESIENTAFGFLLSYLAWKFVVIPMIEAGWFTINDSFIITCIFTVLSLARNYVVRRRNNNKVIKL